MIISRTFICNTFVCALLLFSGCAKQERAKKNRNLDFELLKKQAQEEIVSKRNYEAHETLHTALALYPDHKEISDIHLMLGDLYFSQKEYEESDKEYRAYLKMNPTRGEYASYRSILSAYYQTLKLDRDPTPLSKTIKRCKKHLANQIYATGNIAQDVRDILYTAEKKLIDREVYTFDFYLDHEKYASAENRLKELEKYASQHEGLKARILYLRAKLDLQRENLPDAQTHVHELVESYPQSQYAEMAQQLLVHNEKKASGRFLF